MDFFLSQFSTLSFGECIKSTEKRNENFNCFKLHAVWYMIITDLMHLHESDQTMKIQKLQYFSFFLKQNLSAKILHS